MFWISFLVQLVLAGGSKQAPDGSFLLSRGRAGAVEIGISADELVARLGRDRVRLVDLALEGSVTPALEVMDANRKTVLLTAELREYPCRVLSVWRIRVVDSRFRTAAGYSVGAALGIQQQQSMRPSWNEGHRVVTSPELEMTFELAGDTKIVAIILTRTAEDIKREHCP